VVLAGVSNDRTYARVRHVSAAASNRTAPLARRKGMLMLVAGASGALILAALVLGVVRERRQG
jgi:hypothetical protein